MKTYKNLFPQIVSFSNLVLAYQRAALGKRSRPDVAEFEFDREGNLLALEEALRSGDYRPGPYRNFYIYDPKKRLISAAPFRDRVVHHTLCNVIEPIFEQKFIHDSYACRVGKGTHAALDRCQQYARQYRYVLKCDLESFFPRIDHAVLKDQLDRVIACRETRALYHTIIDGGLGVNSGECEPAYFPGDDLLAGARPRGLPIGNLTSQFWANVHLNPLDHFIKRTLRCRAYVRYVDDFLLFSDDKATLHGWKKAVIDFAVGLRQRLHERESVVFPVATGIPFLGWRVYPTHRRLKRRNGVAFQRRFAALRRGLAAGQISQEQLAASVRGWVAHAAHGDTWGLRRSLLSGVVLPKAGAAA